MNQPGDRSTLGANAIEQRRHGLGIGEVRGEDAGRTRFAAVHLNQGNVDIEFREPVGEIAGAAAAVVGEQDGPVRRDEARPQRQWRIDQPHDQSLYIALSRTGMCDRLDGLGRERRTLFGSAGVRDCGGNVIHDAAQRLQDREFFHFQVRRRTVRVPLKHFRKVAEDFDAFDGVDAEVGFQVEVEAQRFLRVAGAVADQLEQLREQDVASQWFRG